MNTRTLPTPLLLILLSLFSTFSSCSSTQSIRGKSDTNRTSSLHGMVYCDTGQPLSNVKIKLEQQNSIRIVFSDTFGRFLLHDLYPGSFHVSAQKKGYLPLETTELQHEHSRILYVNMHSWQGLIPDIISLLRNKDYAKADVLIEQIMTVAADEWLPHYIRIIRELLLGNTEAALALLPNCPDGPAKHEIEKYITQRVKRIKDYHFEIE